MATFKDNTGVEWTVQANANALAEVEELVGDRIFDGSLINRIIDDPMTCFRALAVLCRQQIRDETLTYEQFSDRLIGDVVDDAALAFVEAVSQFLPAYRGKAMLESARYTVQARRRAIEMATEQLGTTDIDKVAEIMLKGAMQDGVSP